MDTRKPAHSSEDPVEPKIEIFHLATESLNKVIRLKKKNPQRVIAEKKAFK